LERAIDVQPRLLDSHEQRVMLLVETGRFEQALAACQPAVFGDNPPLELRGRAAWVLARKGDVQDAVEAMRSLLREQPDYLWGLTCLLEWQVALGLADEALATADALLRREPTHVTAYGFRGDLRMK